MRMAWLGIGVLFAGVASGQGPALRVSFRTAVESPECGLRLPAFSGAQARGLPTAVTHTYTSAKGDVLQMFDPRELWLARTWRGRWEDKAGNAVTLAEIDRPMPGPFERPHIPSAQFEEAFRAVPPVSDEASLAKWAAAFAGREVAGPAFSAPGGMRLANVKGFVFAVGGKGTAVGYAFHLRPGPTITHTGVHFFVLYEFKDGAAAPACRAAVERDALPAITPIPRRTQASADKRFQNDATALVAARGAEAEISRSAALRSIEGLKGWWHVETTNFVFVSDLPGVRASLVRQLQGDVETLRGAYAALCPPFEPIRDISVIRVFNTRQDYLKHLGPEAGWSGGMWVPSKRELIISPIEFGSVRERKDWIIGVVYHEGLHQYLHYAYRAAPTPCWYNEGHATFFEGAEVGKTGIEVGESARHAETIDKVVAEGGPDFAPLLKLSYPEFYSGTDEGRDRNYSTAWALIYFLRKATPPDRPYAVVLDRCREILKDKAKAAELPPEAAFKDIDIDRIGADFREFWKSPAQRSAARKLNVLTSSTRPAPAAPAPKAPASPR